MEKEKREHQNMMLKMEKEMEEVFERKAREKQQKLKDSEDNLIRRHKESKDKLEQQKQELEARLAAFDQVNFGFIEGQNWQKLVKHGEPEIGQKMVKKWSRINQNRSIHSLHFSCSLFLLFLSKCWQYLSLLQPLDANSTK